MVQERRGVSALIDTLAGRRCVAIRRFELRLGDGQPVESGPIEFTWADGTHLTLDVNADWTLAISGQAWTDPLVGVGEDSREVLEQGSWASREVQLPADLHRFIGEVVTSAVPEFNEVGELAGLSLSFKTRIVAARVLGGALDVRIRH